MTTEKAGGRRMEVSYGKEPFDLRLMCLRLCRNLWKILAVTVVGTLLFGGGYYVKNVLLQPDPGYAASSTYKVEYKENPNAACIAKKVPAPFNTLRPARAAISFTCLLLVRKRDVGEVFCSTNAAASTCAEE